MSKKISPFAALTGAEKQMKWLEYQTIRLPYVETGIDINNCDTHSDSGEQLKKEAETPTYSGASQQRERPQPPPEIPRTMTDLSKSTHRQYDAVIARLKQAELHSRGSQISF